MGARDRKGDLVYWGFPSKKRGGTTPPIIFTELIKITRGATKKGKERTVTRKG